MRFNSERLVYREFNESDFHLFYSVFSNEKVMKYAWIDKFNNEEEILPFFQKVMKNNMTHENRKAFEFAVFLASDDSFVGFADIEIHNKNKFGGFSEIGYFLIENFWGKGFATEIAETLIKICFENLNLHRVTARCNSNNLLSEKVMQKVGMVKEGEFRETRFKNGQWDNEHNYSILIKEWNKLKNEQDFKNIKT